MKKSAALLFGTVVYGYFFAVFLYLIGFVEGMVVPKTIDAGIHSGTPLVQAIIINLALIALFGLQHSIMARQSFKDFITKFVPQPIERSIFVLMTSLLLALLFWQWRPMPAVVWSVGNQTLAQAIMWLSLAGWGLVLLATFLINHFELFGLKQVWLYFNGSQEVPPKFIVPFLYKVIRHPLYLGFIIAFWAAPQMSEGRLLFSIAMTIYILIGATHEEADLVAHFGDRYEEYQKQVPMLVPFTGGKKEAAEFRKT